jgi:hypothetical protein
MRGEIKKLAYLFNTIAPPQKGHKGEFNIIREQEDRVLVTGVFITPRLRKCDFNSRPRNYFITKIDMRKFDGNDPMTWIILDGEIFGSTPSVDSTKGNNFILVCRTCSICVVSMTM